jgi:hypothetical protein
MRGAYVPASLGKADGGAVGSADCRFCSTRIYTAI